jgi:hypothetical protein
VFLILHYRQASILPGAGKIKVKEVNALITNGYIGGSVPFNAMYLTDQFFP